MVYTGLKTALGQNQGRPPQLLLMEYHVLPVAEVAQALGTTPDGLDAATARQRLAEYGPNQLAEAKRETVGRLLLRQLTNVMIVVLLVAAGVAGLVGDFRSVGVILAIVVLNALVGFGQEYQAEKAMAALRRLAAEQAQVVRDGQPLTVPAADLVPGDVLLLNAGDVLAADVRLLETHALRVDESALTGEAANAEKTADALPPGTYALGDRRNLAYRGTSVTNGRATAYVVATGPRTELGQLARLTETAETPTPLQRRLATLSQGLSGAVVGICALFFGAGWLRGEPLLPLLLVAVALGVAAIPEALPALVSMALALGARRLGQSHVLVRQLPAVETLGSVTYICTDKTGTLTMNQMTVLETYAAPDFALPSLAGPDALLTAMALNNDAALTPEGSWLGDSTEVALARYAAERGQARAALESRWPRVGELPFEAERRCMSTLHQTEQGVLCLTKGALGAILPQLAPGEQAGVPALEQRVNALADQGYRVLAYAARLLPALPQTLTPATVETDLTFLGFAGLLDPPRPVACAAVAACRAAGIVPVMITGDHQLTAQAVARQLGILAGADDLVLTGPELAALDEAAFAAIVEKVRVYARADPAQKVRIIQALQARHQCVAMTGDGVNDAPALKSADIGVAMGRGGTEVAKEAADLILLDDNFSTIVEAVRHGRRVYDNIRKFIGYILAGSVAEIWAVFLAPFLGLPLPLLALQILWINLVTDGLSLALAYEPAEAGSMRRPPLDPRQSLFADGLGWFIGWTGLLMGSLTLGLQAWALRGGSAHWQTMTFTVLCFSQLGLGLAVRSRRVPLFRLGLAGNPLLLGAVAGTVALQGLLIYVPFLNRLFHTQPLTAAELGLTIAASGIVFGVVEISKLVGNWRRGLAAGGSSEVSQKAA